MVLLRLNEGESYDLIRDRDDFHFVYSEQHLDPGEVEEVRRQVAVRPRSFPIEDNVNLQLVEPDGRVEPKGEPTDDPFDPLESGGSPASPPEARAAGEGDGVSVVNPHREVLCHMPWTNLHVRIDGSIRVCCHQEAFANVADRSVEEVWNGPELQAMREAIARRELHQLCHRENCPVFRGWSQEQQPEPRPVRVARRALAPLLSPRIG